MLLFDKINTEEQLNEFVQKLNECEPYQQYLLFLEVFKPKVMDLNPKGFPRNSDAIQSDTACNAQRQVLR